MTHAITDEQHQKKCSKLVNKIMNVLCLSYICIFIGTLLTLAVFVYLTQSTDFENKKLSSEYLATMYYFLKPVLFYQHSQLLIVFIPLLGAVITAITGKFSVVLRDIMLVFITFVVFVLIIMLFPQAIDGDIVSTIPGIFGYGLHFKVDMLSFIMLLTSATLWLVVSMYSHEYMNHENHQDRFCLFMLWTFAGVLGTLMASDILTMVFFFEFMTIASYFLVAHNQSRESLLAGNNYLFMSIAGGLALLTAMLLVLFHTNCLSFVALASQLDQIGWVKNLIAGLFIAGFGIKAGMLPLHIWLPKAHPAAPTPASALLSGLLVKTGTYGLLRIATSFYMPERTLIKEGLDNVWKMSSNIGGVIIWIGILTMLTGVFMALQQSNIKKMLAYHSISQMGYIIMGTGVASYLGHIGSMGFAGSIYHTINHALFKSLLFMVAGIVYLRTRQLNMYKLGGLYRQMPFSAFICLIASFGITGMPFFNGFASKSILHHAITEAHHYGHYSFYYAEIIFIIVSAGTACSFIKLFYYVFSGKCPEKYQNLSKEGNGMMQLSMGILALLIVLIGCFPSFLMEKLIIISAKQFAYDKLFISEYLHDMHFFNYSDMMGMITVYIGGIVMFLIGKRLNLFHINIPSWLSIDTAVYTRIYKLVSKSSKNLTEKYECLTNGADILIYLTVLAASMFTVTMFFR